MWGYVRGLGFAFLLFYSSYFGTIFLLTPILPFVFVVPQQAKAVIDIIIHLWKVYLVAMYEVLFQTKVKVFGCLPNHRDCTLMIMNHRTRFDWLYLFSYQVRFGSVNRYTITLKNILKFAPGVGWAMQMAGYIFLDRRWDVDKVIISRGIKLFKKINFKPQILLFPEGTDLTKHTKQRSDQYAEKNNLPKYDFVLHPRTTGFTHIVQEMKNEKMLNSLVDITIAYPHRIPQNESDILSGNFPSEIHFYAKTFPNKAIPEDKEDLDLWCCNQWKRKEEFLSNFYEKKVVPDEEFRTEQEYNEDLLKSLFFTSWVFWTILEILFMLILWFYPILWWYVLACTVFYAYICKFTSGLGLIIATAMNV